MCHATILLYVVLCQHVCNLLYKKEKHIILLFFFPLVCVNGDIRLVNGMAPTEGRVEVCVNMNWGTVCDDFWNAPDAQVVCRQLGFSPMGAMATTFAFFGQGTDPIVLDDVRCTGSEARLIDCPFTATHNCIHLEDAGVRCQNCKHVLIGAIARQRLRQSF